MFVNNKYLGLMLLVAIGFCGCGSGDAESLPTANIKSAPSGDSTTDNVAGGSDTTGSNTNNTISTVPLIDGALSSEPPASQVEQFPEVTLVTSVGNIRVRLNAEEAPETVDNFLYNYVERQFYDGTIFHFVSDGFIAIAGGYDAELNEKELRAPIRNEAGNGLKNVRGTIAMSRNVEYADSATSQFYFNLADNPNLDQSDPENGETYGYCVFGEVIEGMDVLQKIAKTEVHDSGDFTDVPVEPIVIQSARREK